jgi:hypothetical protein
MDCVLNRGKLAKEYVLEDILAGDSLVINDCVIAIWSYFNIII